MENTGHVRSVNVSERKGTRKKPVESGQIHIDPHHGVTGDAHAGDWHRQVSLLAWESIEKARAMGLDVKEGDFAENITTEGMDLLGRATASSRARASSSRSLPAARCLWATPSSSPRWATATASTPRRKRSTRSPRCAPRRQPRRPRRRKRPLPLTPSEFTPLAIGQDSRRASQYPGVPYSLSRPSALRVETRLGATPSQFFGVVHFVLSFNSDFVRIPRMAYGAPCGVCA